MRSSFLVIRSGFYMLNSSNKNIILGLQLAAALSLFALPAQAQNAPSQPRGDAGSPPPVPVPLDRGNLNFSPDNIEKDPIKVEKPLATNLPSESQNLSQDDIVFTPEYLIANPAELESLISQAIRANEVDALRLLLPLYAQVETRDESLIDWGNAMIAMNEGRTDEAVVLYRKLIAALPDNRLLRFQLALALYRNNEMIAAKEQFQRLRSAEISNNDREAIDQFISNIDKRDQWSFSGSLSYVRDDNVNNVAPKGTAQSINGFIVRSAREPESAQGVNFSFDADKKWSVNDNFYASLSTSVSGSYYWDNKNYNDVTGRLAVGGGYRNAKLDLELTPYLQKRFYGFGANGDGELHAYANTAGLRLQGSYWLSNRWRYQGALDFSYDDHIKTYNHLDGKRISASNTILFAPSQKQYWFAGVDVSYKDARSASDAYNRYGARLGWGQEWGKGISTRLTGSYAKRYSKGEDFFGIKRKDDEFNASLTLWHRALHFYGITPRLVLSHSRISSNNAFYEYDTNKVYLDFSKTF